MVGRREEIGGEKENNIYSSLRGERKEPSI